MASRFAELVVAINFLALALLWVTREPEFVPGWADLLRHEEVVNVKNHTDGLTILTKKTVITSLVFKYDHIYF